MIPADVVKTTYLSNENKKCSYNLTTHNRGWFNDIHIPKLTRGKQICRPLLDISNWYIKSRRDNTALVQSARQVDNDFARSMVVDDFEFANVA